MEEFPPLFDPHDGEGEEEEEELLEDSDDEDDVVLGEDEEDAGLHMQDNEMVEMEILLRSINQAITENLAHSPHAIWQLCSLSHHHTSLHRLMLHELDLLSTILPICTHAHTAAQQHALATLVTWSLHESNLPVMMDPKYGIVERLLPLIRHGEGHARTNALRVVLNMSIPDENKLQMVQSPHLVEALHGILKSPLDPLRLEALVTLFSLANSHATVQAMYAVPGLTLTVVEILRNPNETVEMQEHALTFVGNLCHWGDAEVHTLLRDLGVVPLLETLYQRPNYLGLRSMMAWLVLSTHALGHSDPDNDDSVGDRARCARPLVTPRSARSARGSGSESEGEGNGEGVARARALQTLANAGVAPRRLVRVEEEEDVVEEDNNNSNNNSSGEGGEGGAGEPEVVVAGVVHAGVGVDADADADADADVADVADAADAAAAAPSPDHRFSGAQTMRMMVRFFRDVQLTQRAHFLSWDVSEVLLPLVHFVRRDTAHLAQLVTPRTLRHLTCVMAHHPRRNSPWSVELAAELVMRVFVGLGPARAQELAVDNDGALWWQNFVASLRLVKRDGTPKAVACATRALLCVADGDVWVAFCMGRHPRLGCESGVRFLPRDVLPKILRQL